MAELNLPFGREETQAQRRRDGAVTPGTTLVRTWRGRQIRVHVLEDGFEWDGQRFGSLTAVAKAVTGSHVSGPAWFGLTKPRIRA